jgi:hypothetical protein
MTEAIVYAYLVIIMLVLATIAAFLSIDELDLESGTRAALVRPQLIASLVSIASYLEVCGSSLRHM